MEELQSPELRVVGSLGMSVIRPITRVIYKEKWLLLALIQDLVLVPMMIGVVSLIHPYQFKRELNIHSVLLVCTAVK